MKSVNVTDKEIEVFFTKYKNIGFKILTLCMVVSEIFYWYA